MSTRSSFSLGVKSFDVRQKLQGTPGIVQILSQLGIESFYILVGAFMYFLRFYHLYIYIYHSLFISTCFRTYLKEFICLTDSRFACFMFF